jgi:hypothetical protein
MIEVQNDVNHADMRCGKSDNSLGFDFWIVYITGT